MSRLSAVPPFHALVLEDHRFQRAIATRVLKRCGAANVDEAETAPQAISLLEQAGARYDLLLCDLKMPGMDGLEFMRRIAERRCASAVILVSGLEPAIVRSAEAMARSYGVRLLGAIEKPITPNKLLPLVLRNFGQSMAPVRPRTEPMPLPSVCAALEQGQFEPFFQPKVAMRDCVLVGAEALLRWRHPTQGLIAPAAFIPVLEAGGLITEATHQLLDKVVVACRIWHEQHLHVPVAINVAVESLHDTQLPEQFCKRVFDAGLDPGMFTIEITETTAMTDVGHSLETLARLRMKGFGLSIDDYGTGFSSMQQLTRIPFSELKVDQMFVTGAAGNPVLGALLEASVDIARRLGLKTVAEGVESAEDWDFAARLGCDAAQGFFIARPMAAAELPGWYRHWRGAHPRSAERPGRDG